MKKAFTLVELLVVLAIIAVLMTMLVVALIPAAKDTAEGARCQTNLKNLALAAQSAAKEHKYHFYPLAGSREIFSITESHGTGNKVEESYTEQTGWISWNSNGAYRSPKNNHTSSGSWFMSAYNSDQKAGYYCITNGALWKWVHHNAACYRCPLHMKRFKRGGKTPHWSYVMNGFFGWDTSKGSDSFTWAGVVMTDLKHPDRLLLFAELQWEDLPNQKANTGTGSGTQNDCTLQYEGGDRESIGFDHKEGNDYYAHIVFADGHVSRLRWTPDQDMKQLTEWLCNGEDFAYDPRSKKYEKFNDVK